MSSVYCLEKKNGIQCFRTLHFILMYVYAVVENNWHLNCDICYLYWEKFVGYTFSLFTLLFRYLPRILYRYTLYSDIHWICICLFENFWIYNWLDIFYFPHLGNFVAMKKKSCRCKNTRYILTHQMPK